MAAATATLVLSAAQAGCILGRGGSNITQIRQARAPPARLRLGHAAPTAP
jgi:ribosomal protein S3